jgi:hypothetical protein
MDISIKAHDTKGKFVDTLKIDGEPVDLSGSTVSWLIKKAPIAWKRPAVITYPDDQADDTKRGAVEYQPIPEDVETKGKFKQEWEVVFNDGKILTFPNDGYNNLNILEDLG